VLTDAASRSLGEVAFCGPLPGPVPLAGSRLPHTAIAYRCRSTRLSEAARQPIIMLCTTQATAGPHRTHKGYIPKRAWGKCSGVRPRPGPLVLRCLHSYSSRDSQAAVQGPASLP
jgi:hypothetical protein